MTKVRVLMAVAAVAAAVGAWLAYAAPPEALQRNYARILHIHAPSAWLAFLAFGVTALGSVVWRITRKRSAVANWWDRLAASSAEIGVLFTGVALVTGMIWGKPVWGVFFDWADARMASTAVMFLVYLGYLALRRVTPDPELRASRSSILGILAVIQVPLVYFSVNLIRTLHQTQSIRPDGAAMHPAMVRALLVNLAAFTLIYLALLSGRMVVGRLEDARRENLPVAGAVVLPPNLSGTPNRSET
jgi:heme exporter protein C